MNEQTTGSAVESEAVASGPSSVGNAVFGFIRGLFGGGSGPQDRKTVTFGDSGAVRSIPGYSILALVLLVVAWWVVTKAWGLPEDFQAETAAAYAEKGESDLLTDARLLIECRVAENCSEDSYTRITKPTQLPTPADTWQAFNRIRTDGYRNISLWEHMGTSLKRVFVGMIVGCLLGIPLGFAMGLSSKVRGFLDTPVELFRPIPPLALIPLFILWFGIGDPSSYALLIFASIWIMLISARSGVRAVSLSKVRAAYSLGASRSQILFRLIVPNALPELFTGFRVALGVSWGTLVAAELVGTDTGLGAMIFQARNFLQTDVVVVGIVIIAVIGVLFDVVVRFLESILIPWRGKAG